jgi:hypothetical protein
VDTPPGQDFLILFNCPRHHCRRSQSDIRHTIFVVFGFGFFWLRCSPLNHPMQPQAHHPDGERKNHFMKIKRGLVLLAGLFLLNANAFS